MDTRQNVALMAMALDRAMQATDEALRLMRKHEEPVRDVEKAFGALAERRQELIHSVDPQLSDDESQFSGMMGEQRWT